VFGDRGEDVVTEGTVTAVGRPAGVVEERFEVFDAALERGG
jgi:hypothetical protein